jgi:hypothetical protein
MYHCSLFIVHRVIVLFIRHRVALWYSLVNMGDARGEGHQAVPR